MGSRQCSAWQVERECVGLAAEWQSVLQRCSQTHQATILLAAVPSAIAHCVQCLPCGRGSDVTCAAGNERSAHLRQSRSLFEHRAHQLATMRAEPSRSMRRTWRIVTAKKEGQGVTAQ